MRKAHRRTQIFASLTGEVALAKAGQELAEASQWTLHAAIYGVSKSGADVGGASAHEAKESIQSLQDALARWQAAVGEIEKGK
jgi:hypothetical protein